MTYTVHFVMRTSKCAQNYDALSPSPLTLVRIRVHDRERETISKCRPIAGNRVNWNSLTDSDRIALDSLLVEPSSKPRIVVGSDHAGFRAKETIKKYLQGAGYVV